MKRFPYPIVWSTIASLVLSSVFVFEIKSRAQSLTDVQSVDWQDAAYAGPAGRKVSDDILQKVAQGKGAEFVRNSCSIARLKQQARATFAS
jgi:hypothetical protein